MNIESFYYAAHPKAEQLLAYYIKERMDIFWGRMSGMEPPFTEDPILSGYRFTNVYRVTDRVSQWLIRNVQAANDSTSPENLIFITLLFKTFNQPNTWITLANVLGHEPSLDTFDFDVYTSALDEVRAINGLLYNNAYMMTSDMKYGYKIKHYNHLRWFEHVAESGLCSTLLRCKTFNALHDTLAQQNYIGPFLAYQYATDLNYLPIWGFPEHSLCKATIGSRRGVEKVLHDGYKRRAKHADIIYFYAAHQEEFFTHYDIEFTNLFGRQLQPIDFQNCFCEIDKYLRVAEPTITTSGGYQNVRIKNSYARQQPEPYVLMFPRHWAISEFNNIYTVY